MFSGRVFIAYAREDQEFVRALADELETAGLTVLWDKLLRGGVWRTEIARHLGVTDALIVVLSPVSVQSDEVKAEVQDAIDSGVRKIVPVILKDCRPFTPLNIYHYVRVDHAKEPLGDRDDHRPRVVPLAAILGALNGPARPKRVFATSNCPEFHLCAEDLIRKAERRVIFVGTGLNLLQSETLAYDVIRRGASDSRETMILLANPASPGVQARLIEEELGSPPPGVGRPGIYQRVDALLRTWMREGSPASVSIRLFNHCPAFALIIIDDDYFLYPYGYKTLGNFSPVISFSKDADPEAAKFLDDQYELIRDDSIDAQAALRLRGGGPAPAAESLVPMAIYFVPPADSALYQFGSQVLGCDVRQQGTTSSPWADRIGTARDYGFHLTVGDALYYSTEAAARTAAAEVEFLCKEFDSFNLTNLRLEKNMPAVGSISIVAEDPTGSLEALHAEMVARVYRRAAASNYTLGRAEADRDQDVERTRLMIDRYRAPYVLARYRPHFTLLTASRDVDADLTDLQRLWEQLRCPSVVRVERLAIMERMDSGAWAIKREVEVAR